MRPTDPQTQRVQYFLSLLLKTNIAFSRSFYLVLSNTLVFTVSIKLSNLKINYSINQSITLALIIPSQMEVAPLHCTVDITQKRGLFKNTKEIEKM